MMLGFLLARAGIDVIVLEKHADFFRDFRGDTIHPSTFQLMKELGLLDEFLQVPHQEIERFTAVFNHTPLQIADFTHLPGAKKAIGMMPQWDFLKFLQQQASQYSCFKLIMNAEVTDTITENGRVTGVKTSSKDGRSEITAAVVVACDGRHSLLREKAGLKVIRSGVPIDVLWFRVSRQQTDPSQILGRFSSGIIMVMLDRNDYWQCAYLIAKGGYEKIKEKGLEAFGNNITQVAPFLADRVDELKKWEDIKLLSVDIDRLQTWYTEALLCIGDAAHAMSPVGGVGINLAIQDAVATANILYGPLREKKQIDNSMLHRVQKRRTLPTRFIQRLQTTIQNSVFQKRLSATNKTMKPPLFMRLLNAFPLLQRFPAYAVGIGLRPEHIQTPDVGRAAK